MNYYERIQRAIDYGEENICEEVRAEDMARRAYMSLSNFHRMFFALSGFSAAEYLRNRRISMAAAELRAGEKVLDTAVKYSYDSADAFSRAFRKATGFLPSEYRTDGMNYVFERMDVMEKYYDEQDPALLEEYPDIKVLKELPPMKVAYTCYTGKNPEDGAFRVMAAWVKKQGLRLDGGAHRIFGYNAPDTQPGAEEYGYEVCVTLPEDYSFADDVVKTKYLTGGKYIVCHVERSREDIGEDIMRAWQRLNKWIAKSRYVYDGSVQWMEEHLGFDEDNHHKGGVDLYGAIALRGSLDSKTELLEREPVRVHAVTVTGINCEDRGRRMALDWVAEKGLDLGKCEVFAFYDYAKIGTKEFSFTVYIAPNKANASLAEGEFPGGKFALRRTRYKHNGQEWFRFIEDLSKDAKYEIDNSRPFLERYEITAPRVTGETDVAQYMPVKERGT